MQLVKEWTVKRSLWFRGQGADESRLLIEDGPNAGMMCCLGHRCLAQGFSPIDIEDKGFPSDLEDIDANLAFSLEDSLGTQTSHFRQYAIGEINDSPLLSDAERETKLIAKFAEIGETVTFVD